MAAKRLRDDTANAQEVIYSGVGTPADDSRFLWTDVKGTRTCVRSMTLADGDLFQRIDWRKLGIVEH